jgi:hypothetical protein
MLMKWLKARRYTGAPGIGLTNTSRLSWSWQRSFTPGEDPRYAVFDTPTYLRRGTRIDLSGKGSD